jgi:hypothetical protein
MGGVTQTAPGPSAQQHPTTPQWDQNLTPADRAKKVIPKLKDLLLEKFKLQNFSDFHQKKYSPIFDQYAEYNNNRTLSMSYQKFIILLADLENWVSTHHSIGKADVGLIRTEGPNIFSY